MNTPKNTETSPTTNNLPSLPLPDALFPCMFESCSEEASYPPDMLFWADDGLEKRGWVCDSCWDYSEWSNGEAPPRGISLKDEIIRQDNA